VKLKKLGGDDVENNTVTTSALNVKIQPAFGNSTRVATVAWVPSYRMASFSVPYQQSLAIGTIVTVPMAPRWGVKIDNLVLQVG
jgi:hypothetical protein